MDDRHEELLLPLYFSPSSTSRCTHASLSFSLWCLCSTGGARSCGSLHRWPSSSTPPYPALAAPFSFRLDFLRISVRDYPPFLATALSCPLVQYLYCTLYYSQG